MSVKIRLQRHGRKQAPYYHIVVADARAPRDGKFIELIGSYKPQTVPATIELNTEKAIKWLENGAQPTDTVRAILSYKGVLLQRHLDAGIRKGALTQEQADAKLAKWLEEKNAKVEADITKQSTKKTDTNATRLAAEVKANAARAAKIAEKQAAMDAAANPVAEVEEEVVAEVEATPEVVAEVEATPEVVAEVEATPEVEAEVEATPEVEAATEETPEA
jgi:small subunit ribosomal protein S16